MPRLLAQAVHCLQYFILLLLPLFRLLPLLLCLPHINFRLPRLLPLPRYLGFNQTRATCKNTVTQI